MLVEWEGHSMYKHEPPFESQCPFGLMFVRPHRRSIVPCRQAWCQFWWIVGYPRLRRTFFVAG